MPLGACPVLKVGEEVFCQTKAIEAYLGLVEFHYTIWIDRIKLVFVWKFSAKKFGYVSEDPVDQLKAEMYMETQQVIQNHRIFFLFTEIRVIKTF